MADKCRACAGLGWIETSDKKPHACPVCEGDGYAPPRRDREESRVAGGGAKPGQDFHKGERP